VIFCHISAGTSVGSANGGDGKDLSDFGGGWHLIIPNNKEDHLKLFEVGASFLRAGEFSFQIYLTLDSPHRLCFHWSNVRFTNSERLEHRLPKVYPRTIQCGQARYNLTQSSNGSLGNDPKQWVDHVETNRHAVDLYRS
jgi:hypothetical protein